MQSEYLSAHMIMSCSDISQRRRHAVYSVRWREKYLKYSKGVFEDLDLINSLIFRNAINS